MKKESFPSRYSICEYGGDLNKTVTLVFILEFRSIQTKWHQKQNGELLFLFTDAESRAISNVFNATLQRFIFTQALVRFNLCSELKPLKN